MGDADFQQWVDKAYAASVQELLEREGLWTKQMNGDRGVPCPVCGGNDRFSVNTRKNVFQCRASGASGGALAFLAHQAGVDRLKGQDFIAAVERITREPLPRNVANESEEDRNARLERADAIAKRRREERRDETIMQAIEEKKEVERKKSAAVRLWDEGLAFAGSHADAYMRARGLYLAEEHMQDLRFIPDLPYRGYATPDDDHETDLGEFPAMIAAIRNVRHEIIGVHRTYLDRRRPIKLKPTPGDSDRNEAKKAFGKVGGGAIWLGPVRPTIILAEGIETALSWWAFRKEGYREATPVAAYSLGNLTGSATGSVPHPKIKGVMIPNGVPDMDKPGIILPREVTDVMIIGDGDSEWVATHTKLLAAMARFKAEGRSALISMAPQGLDFNDVLLQHLSEMAA